MLHWWNSLVHLYVLCSLPVHYKVLDSWDFHRFGIFLLVCRYGKLANLLNFLHCNCTDNAQNMRIMIKSIKYKFEEKTFLPTPIIVHLRCPLNNIVFFRANRMMEHPILSALLFTIWVKCLIGRSAGLPKCCTTSILVIFLCSLNHVLKASSTAARIGTCLFFSQIE